MIIESHFFENLAPGETDKFPRWDVCTKSSASRIRARFSAAN
jgi:hypothetical protein